MTPTFPQNINFYIQFMTNIKNFICIAIFQVPFITDGNPHQEGLLDQRRVIYLPYSEDKNLVMELPNAPGLLFLSQLISSGGEIIFALDKVVHKYWVIAIHQVYTPPKVNYDEKIFNFL